MADPRPYLDSDDGARVRAHTESTSGTPRWVYVFGIIALVAVLLFAIVMLTGGGSHGPGRHTPSGDTGGHTPLAGAMRHSGPQL